MRNKKLIPFEVIERAVAGEPEAVDAVLRHYTAHIKYLSMYKGYIVTTGEKRYKGHRQRKVQTEGFFSRNASAKPKTIQWD